MILEEPGTSIFKVKVNTQFYSEDADCIQFQNIRTYLPYNRVSRPKDYKPLQISKVHICYNYRSRKEGKIYNNLLKELFMMRIRSVLAKQASTIQRKK
jgi:hypothetical protein